MRIPKAATLAVRELSERGIPFKIEQGGKHAHLVVDLGMRSHRFPISRSTRPAKKAAYHLRGDIRRTIGATP